MHPGVRVAAELGYGDGDEATIIDFGGDPNNKYTTTYFRRDFTVANASGSYGFGHFAEAGRWRGRLHQWNRGAGGEYRFEPVV